MKAFIQKALPLVLLVMVVFVLYRRTGVQNIMNDQQKQEQTDEIRDFEQRSVVSDKTVHTQYAENELIVEDFENGRKEAYKASEVALGSGTWILDDAIIASSERDPRNGSKSVRIRNNGKISTRFRLAIERLSVNTAVYGSDGPSEWQLWQSADDGSTWTQVNGTFTTSGNSLSKTVVEISNQSPSIFEIRRTGGNANARLNVDDITFKGVSSSPSPIDIPDPEVGRDDHLALGIPSKAKADPASANDYLMVKPQYALSYNRSRNTANWVSWHLNKDWQGNTRRSNNFMPDNTLPDGWYKVSTGDYTGSGFDRGHLCPSSDRDATPEDNQSTFLMVNIVPQSPAHNQEPWRMLEEYCRKLANDGFEMYIIAGVRGQGGTGKNGSAQTIGQNQPITVPESLWKIIVVLPNGANDIQRIDTSTRIIAVDMPNTEVVSKTNWQQYIVSVDDIERATGYDFLSNVPKNIQRVIEARKDKGQ